MEEETDMAPMDFAEYLRKQAFQKQQSLLK